MNSIKISKILLVFVVILLVTIPIMAYYEISAEAGSTEESITTYNDDYIFFVVEDNKTPLAAAPHVTSTHVSPVLWVVVSTFIGVLGICYISWYLMLRENTRTFANKLPSYLRNRRTYKGSIFHPIRSMEYSCDMVYDVTKNYFAD